MKMTVATIGLKFDSNKPINELSIKMPDCTKILSVQANNDKSILSINFMASTGMFESDLWREYHFAICKCNYTDIDVTDYKYIGTVNEGNYAFAVFYKEGLIV